MRRCLKKMACAVVAVAFALTLTAAIDGLNDIPGSEAAFAAETPQSDKVVEVAGEEINQQIPEEKLADSDELLEEYLIQTAEEDIKGSKAIKKNSLKTSRTNRLSGYNKIIYDALKKKIIKIADGSEGNTVVSFPIAQYYLDGSNNSEEYTAEDLGLQSLVASDGTISEETTTALLGKKGIDPEAIINNLLVDVPYELYWFDKTGFSHGLETIFYYGEKLYPGYVDEKNPNGLTLTFHFTVSPDYRAAGTSEDNDTTADVGKTKAASSTAERAATVVRDKSNLSDYMKLKEYKDWICGEVEYNETVTSGMVHYGDPWQIIYVFDGNNSTDVVCEGYSKAFKYLCDITKFSDSGIECYLVTGVMSGGTGAGNHMWNNVHMGNGKNYLVDVTNCDNGSIGYSDKLFMVGNAQGSSADYVFGNSHGLSYDVTYTYDNVTLNTYTDDELLIADANYDPDNPGGDNDNTGGNNDNPGGNNDNTGGNNDNTGGNNDNPGGNNDNTGGNPDNPGGDNDQENEVVDIKVSGITNKTYTGSEITQNPRVTAGDAVLRNGVDYRLTYSNNYNAGRATMTITFIGQYAWAGSETTAFMIDPKTITPTVALNASNFNYTGRTITPRVTVKDGWAFLPASQYTVSHSKGRKNVGRYSVRVTLKGNYRGARTVYYTIGPKATAMGAPKAEKKGFTARWSRQLAKMPRTQIAGYQVQWSLKANFKSGNRARNVAGAKKTSLKVGGLKSNAKYYVRVRTYMKSGGRVYYSNWSKARVVRVK